MTPSLLTFFQALNKHPHKCIWNVGGLTHCHHHCWKNSQKSQHRKTAKWRTFLFSNILMRHFWVIFQHCVRTMRMAMWSLHSSALLLENKRGSRWLTSLLFFAVDSFPFFFPCSFWTRSENQSFGHSSGVSYQYCFRQAWCSSKILACQDT